ncbi:hypothetical protein [Winogradskyella forsetii]|uniref:hypothetical protein n=1 Tax=Winogradskyella forsetii TaxID=2686077 RepID=UPI0015C000D6|nr:hypothetical protein [Winogradskyella forsetii]
MKTDFIPFSIGQQYEHYEFKLSEEETILIDNYEYVVYRCNEKLFENIKIKG